MDTAQLIQRAARPLGGVTLLELQELRTQLAMGRREQEARLDKVETKRDLLFADGAGRPDLRGQQARASQVAVLEAEANQVALLLRLAHKQLLLLDRLIWLRESLDAIERLHQATPTAVPIDWPALVAATAPLDDEAPRRTKRRWSRRIARPARRPAAGRHPQQRDAALRARARRRQDRIEDGRRVRYIGIDCPQMANALGRPDAGAAEAYAANSRLVDRRCVRLEADQLDADADGALWRYVYVDDVLVNAELLRQGAVYYAGRYPNNRLAELLLAAEQSAAPKTRPVADNRLNLQSSVCDLQSCIGVTMQLHLDRAKEHLQASVEAQESGDLTGARSHLLQAALHAGGRAAHQQSPGPGAAPGLR